MPPFLRTVTVMQVDGCPAKVWLEEDTLTPRALETRPSFAWAKALSATAGLNRSSIASSGLVPWKARHCCVDEPDEADEPDDADDEEAHAASPYRVCVVVPAC